MLTSVAEWMRCVFFFFFQAEDGIRDYKVTGVQTCALPIFLDVEEGRVAALARQAQLELVAGEERPGRGQDPVQRPARRAHGLPEAVDDEEIGRASCRGRV